LLFWLAAHTPEGAEYGAISRLSGQMQQGRPNCPTGLRKTAKRLALFIPQNSSVIFAGRQGKNEVRWQIPLQQ
jgi:hypothetical protein